MPRCSFVRNRGASQRLVGTGDSIKFIPFHSRKNEVWRFHDLDVVLDMLGNYLDVLLLFVGVFT